MVDRRDRRVDPLVEVDLVPGVQEDPEERVAEVAVDDVEQRAAGLPDVQRPVPLGDRLEVRRHQPLDVVADPVRQLRRVLDDEAGAAVERAPDPERDREPVAALDRPVARAEEAERRRARPRSASGGTTAASRSSRAGATASRSVMPGRRPPQQPRTPLEVWQAAHSMAASCSTSLITRSPVAGSIRRSVAFSTTPCGAAARSSSTRKAGASMVARLA